MHKNSLLSIPTLFKLRMATSGPFSQLLCGVRTQIAHSPQTSAASDTQLVVQNNIGTRTYGRYLFYGAERSTLQKIARFLVRLSQTLDGLGTSVQG